MSPVFRMTTLRPYRAIAEEIVRSSPDLLGFPQNLVDGLNDAVQLLPIFHTDSASKRRAPLVLPKTAVKEKPLVSC